MSFLIIALIIGVGAANLVDTLKPYKSHERMQDKDPYQEMVHMDQKVEQETNTKCDKDCFHVRHDGKSQTVRVVPK